MEAALQDERDYAQVVSRPDMFVIDNAATVSAKILARRAKRVRKKLRVTKAADSRTEARLVEKMVAKVRRRRAETSAEVPVHDDLWGQDAGAAPPPPPPKKGKAAEVAAPGQSYNPSLEDHQAVVRTAVAVETARVAKV
ncbi:MAG: hypothetical protein AAFU77_18450, partial [Myxococcota bacterium]